MMVQAHACSADWVMRESLRLFPLDLAARVAWIDEMAYASTSESDRHEILRRLARLRGMG